MAEASIAEVCQRSARSDCHNERRERHAGCAMCEFHGPQRERDRRGRLPEADVPRRSACETRHPGHRIPRNASVGHRRSTQNERSPGQQLANAFRISASSASPIACVSVMDDSLVSSMSHDPSALVWFIAYGLSASEQAFAQVTGVKPQPARAARVPNACQSTTSLPV